jgi:hypothetical protein
MVFVTLTSLFDEKRIKFYSFFILMIVGNFHMCGQLNLEEKIINNMLFAIDNSDISIITIVSFIDTFIKGGNSILRQMKCNL